MAIRDIQAVVYTDDEGNDWQTGQDAAIFAQGVTGGSDYDGSPALLPLPREIKPRGVYVANGTNRRFVVCLTSDATLYTGAVTAVDLRQIGAAGVVSYTRVRPKREKDLRRFRNPAG